MYVYLLLQLLVAPLVLVMHKGIIHCCPIYVPKQNCRDLLSHSLGSARKCQEKNH